MNKSEHIWVFKISGFVAWVLLILSSCQSSDVSSLQSVINNISVSQVPDQRIGICSIKVKSGDYGAIILKGETTSPTAKNDIINTLNKSVKVLIDSIIILPDTIKNENYLGLVTLSVINLRKEPDHVSELVSQAILGTPVLILKEESSWLMIQTPDNYISWTEKSSVKLMNSKEIKAWKKALRVIYTDNTGWLYDTASYKSGVVGDVVGGSIMEKTGEVKEYDIIILPDGRKGLVEKKKVLDFDSWKSDVACTEESICKTSETFLGVPYLWGGSSPKGVDCSGFVQAVYFRNGLILSRDASLQALHGMTVDISDGFSRLRRGDLLFFGSKENGNLHVTHVAIYLGNSEYINSSGRVMINSLDSKRKDYISYRMNSLLGAKRIIGVAGDNGIVPVINHPWY